jgi:hypothetical protein
MTARDAAAYFPHGRFDGKQWDDTLGNQTLARTRPFFQQPIVVSLDTGQLQLGILDSAKCFAANPRDRRIEHGVLNAGRIHCL